MHPSQALYNEHYLKPVQLAPDLRGFVVGYTTDSPLMIAAVCDKHSLRGWGWAMRLGTDWIHPAYRHMRFLYCRESELIEEL